MNKIKIMSEEAACKECNALLSDSAFSMEKSSFGDRAIGFVRFTSEQVEKEYELHLLNFHGLIK